MRIIKFFIALSFLLVIGCSESIMDANLPEANQNSSQSWIQLNKTSGSSVETQYSSSAVVRRDKGGKIVIKENSNGIKINSELEIPENAFSGQDKLLITLSLDDQTTSVTFNPSPFIFDKNLSFDLEYEGLDLGGVDPATVEFVYMAPDGSFISAEYDNIEVTHDKLKVKDAKISHFSRYGFIKGPETGE